MGQGTGLNAVSQDLHYGSAAASLNSHSLINCWLNVLDVGILDLSFFNDENSRNTYK